jgi:DNA-binding GntR family transcriptional regulator
MMVGIAAGGAELTTSAIAMTPRVAPSPIPEQVADALVTMIATGQLEPGQRLIEAELARTFAISRVPVREAIRTLEAQGILETAPNRGTYVRRFDETHIAQLAEVRYALELIALREVLYRARREPGVLDGLDAPIAEMERCLARGDRHGLDRADIAFHRELCRIAGNEIVAKVWEGLSRHLLVTFGLMTGRYPDSDAIVADHHALKAYLAAGPEGELEARLANHIGGLPPRLATRFGDNVQDRERSHVDNEQGAATRAAGGGARGRRPGAGAAGHGTGR